MRFSLVLATLGRTTEVSRFLASVAAQGTSEVEVIVVDQNRDERLTDVLAPFRDAFPVVHLRSEPGLSRARNVGLRHVTGDVVAFPDDDCWYPEAVLSYVADELRAHPAWHGITGRSVDALGNDSAYTFPRDPSRVDRFTVWQRAISYGIFLRRPVIAAVGDFDETLGLGSRTAFGSGEETDYLVRAIDSGFHIQYSPALVVHHPQREEVIDEALLRRTYSYGCGMGRVLAKHHYPAWFKARSVIRPLGGALLALTKRSRPRAALHWRRCMGRAVGMWS